MTTTPPLETLVAESRWQDAFQLASAPSSPTPPPYVSYLAQQALLTATPSYLSPDFLSRVVPLILDKQWLASATLQLAPSLDDPDTLRAVLQAGLEATDSVINTTEELSEAVERHDVAALKELSAVDDDVRRLCLVRRALLELGDKLKTWDEVWGGDGLLPRAGTPDTPTMRKRGDNKNPQEEGTAGKKDGSEDEEDAAWGDMSIPSESSENDSDDEDPSPTPPARELVDDPAQPTLSSFVAQPVIATALILSASNEIPALKILCTRHTDEVWPSRFDLIDAIPEWEDPAEYASLLPRLDAAGNEEIKWESTRWRTEEDWVERVRPATVEGPKSEPLPATELTTYYVERIEHIASLGLVAVAFSFVQHCASTGIPGLENLGEELSLLSKLVYDRPSPSPVASTSTSPPSFNDDEDLTLDYWRSLSPSEIVLAYLANSTPATIANSIRRLVLPYLSVLESHLERAGTPDPALPSRLLNDYILSLPNASSQEASLDLLVAIFEASKPTLPMGSRLVKSDEELARLAIASLYGCHAKTADALVSMGKIFECLPALEDPASLAAPSTPSRPKKHRHDLFALYPSSLSPASSPEAPTPSSLFTSLTPFPPSSLSLALDALDLHLSTAETFSRYSVPVPLSWFLLSHNDAKLQRAWATRMARTSASGGGGKEGDEGEFESEDEWVALMEDMVTLVEGKDGPEGGKKAFWLLEREEVLSVFFGGLLGAGRIGLAKSLFQPSSMDAPLEPHVVEKLVIAASREFYDNAESGNLNKGDMKLAFECLAAAPQTAEIRKERDFIEATSRLCSFKIQTHPGVPLAPIEIRLSKDRLAFVGRLLTANEDAYRHPDMILDLVAKLGYRGDRLAEVRTLAMIGDSSLQAGDFDRTAETCDKMVAAVETLRKVRVAEEQQGKPVVNVDEAAEFAWRNCFQLGKHEAFDDLDRRMQAMGQALILCPGDKIATLLPLWTKLEDQVARQGPRPVKVSKKQAPHSFIPPSLGRVASPSMPSPSETTAAASRTFNRAAAALFGGPLPPPSSSSSAGDRHSGEYEREAAPTSGSASGGGGGGVRAGLSSRLTRGVGWLIGADEERERESVQKDKGDWDEPEVDDDDEGWA